MEARRAASVRPLKLLEGALRTMTIYWLLLAYPAVMAFLFPDVRGRHGVSVGQALALLAFAVFYTGMSFFRFEVGADWYAYDTMYQTARSTPFEGALSISDPLFSFLLWVSAQLGWGIYMPNAVCSLVLVIGVIMLAVQLRQPWLAILAAVPYLLIVVGLGYIRQAAAIGFILMALASVGKGAMFRSVILLALAGGFHSTAAGVFPFFALAIANRNKLRMFLITALGSAGLVIFLSRQLEFFETTYIDSDYQSAGAWIRIGLSALASFFILFRWRTFDCPPRTRSIWIGIAIANFVAMALLLLITSSTAVDRVSLYFSIIQLVFFANISQLLRFSGRMELFGRLLVAGTAVAVQLVWLVFATHANSWVPYKTIVL